jgi:hypothetical protein
VSGDHILHCGNTSPSDGIHNHFDFNKRDMKYPFEINLMGINYSKSLA